MDERPGRPSWFRDKRSERWGLGDAIRARREEVKLSRRDLAERAGLSYPYLSELETGKKRGSPDSIRSVADALGLGQDELWARADALAGATPSRRRWPPRPPLPRPQRRGRPTPEPAPTELAQRVADALAGATPAEAEAALLMALGELRYRRRLRPASPTAASGEHRPPPGPLSRCAARPRGRRRRRRGGRVPAAGHLRAAHRHGRRRAAPAANWRMDRRHLDGALPGREPDRDRRLRPRRPAAALCALVPRGPPLEHRALLRHRQRDARGPRALRADRRALPRRRRSPTPPATAR